jgi:hypothetical protein
MTWWMLPADQCPAWVASVGADGSSCWKVGLGVSEAVVSWLDVHGLYTANESLWLPWPTNLFVPHGHAGLHTMRMTVSSVHHV